MTTGKRAEVNDRETSERLSLGSVVIKVRVASEHTDGDFALIEYEAPARFPGPPRHVHPAFDELFYVIEGEVHLRHGEEEIAARAGASVYVPGNQPHTFSNPGDAVARMLVIVVPGGFERFFRDAVAAGKGEMPPPEVMARLNAEHGVEFVD